jgi:hypothetical protein
MSTMQEPSIDRDRELIRDCLKAIDPNRSRPDLINVLTVCKDNGVPMHEVYAWSARATKPATYRRFEIDWKSSGRRQSGGVGIGTLVHYAKADSPGCFLHPYGLEESSDPAFNRHLPKEWQGMPVVEAYEYESHDWNAFVVGRYSTPNRTDAVSVGDEVFLPFHWIKGEGKGWVVGVGPNRWPLYWRGDRKARYIDVVEGEKCADALTRLYDPLNGRDPFSRITTRGIGNDESRAFVTNQGATEGIDRADWGVLAGRHVCVWPDNDEPGKVYAERVVEMAKSVGAASVRVCAPFTGNDMTCESDDGLDVADYIDWATNDAHYPKERQRSFLSDRRESAEVKVKEVKDGGPWSVKSALDDVYASLPRMHERNWLGMRLGRWPKVDESLCGLRGLLILTAAPGVGKTQLTAQWATDVLESNPEACVVYVTLEMSREELATRMVAIQAGTEYRRLLVGDPREHFQSNGMRLTAALVTKLGEARRYLEDFGPRLVLVDKWQLDPNPNREGAERDAWVERMATFIDECKARAGAERALVVVDNLQAIPTPMADAADTFARDVRTIEGMRTLHTRLAGGQLDGDALLLVSEVSEIGFTFGSGQGDVHGTGRNAFRADGVWGLTHRNYVSANDPYDRDKVVPADPRQLKLTLWKGRAGMNRGDINLSWNDEYSALSED